LEILEGIEIYTIMKKGGLCFTSGYLTIFVKDVPWRI